MGFRLFIRPEHVCKNCKKMFRPNKQSKIYNNDFCDFDCRNGWFNGKQQRAFLDQISFVEKLLKERSSK